MNTSAHIHYGQRNNLIMLAVLDVSSVPSRLFAVRDSRSCNVLYCITMWERYEARICNDTTLQYSEERYKLFRLSLLICRWSDRLRGPPLPIFVLNFRSGCNCIVSSC